MLYRTFLRRIEGIPEADLLTEELKKPKGGHSGKMSPEPFSLLKQLGWRGHMIRRRPFVITGLRGDAGAVIRIPGKIGNAQVWFIPKTLFRGNPTVTDIILPAAVSRISEGAFAGCRNLQRITIPKRVREIPGDAFAGCTSLRDIYYEGTPEEWELVEKNFEKRKIIYGGLIPGTPVESVLEEYIERTPGNEALYTASVHFRCPLSAPEKESPDCEETGNTETDSE